jgi:signal transduction histidine kinase
MNDAPADEETAGPPEPDLRAQAEARLGLTVARAIVEKHGGTLAVVSTVGAGTTAEITLPAAAPVPPGRRLLTGC